MKQYVTALKTKSLITKDLLDIATESGGWYMYYNFCAKEVPAEVTAKDPLFAALTSKGYEYKVGLLEMSPYTNYDWHVDDRRGVGINMLLTPEDISICMFTDDITKVVKPFVEHTYDPDTYYIFNTQKPHSIVNGYKPRYLMSVEFDLDKSYLSYQQLVDDLTGEI